MALGACRHNSIADLADNARGAWIFQWRSPTHTVEPHGGTALREGGHGFHPVEAGHAGRRIFGQQFLVELGGFDGFGAVGENFTLGIKEFAAVIEEEICPQCHIGIAQAATDKAECARCRISQLFSGSNHFVKGFRNGNVLLFEHFLVVIEDEIIHRPGQGQQAALVIFGIFQTCSRKIAFGQI